MMLPEAGQNTCVLNPGSRLGKCSAHTRKGERKVEGGGWREGNSGESGGQKKR